ncbi:MAG: zinc/manganese transport system substrate-binding protein [Gammaproteobacteria bacterium]
MRIASRPKSVLRLAGLFGAVALTSQAQALNVFACEPPAAALVTTLLPSAKVTSATTPWQDPHHIEARPSLISKLRKADLLVCTGASLEAGWLPVLLRRASNRDVQPGQSGHFMMADHVQLIDQLSHSDRSMGDVHAEGNPHLWMSPDNLLLVSAALAERLTQLEPKSSGAIAKAEQAFAEQMRTKSKQWQAAMVPLRGKNVVAYHANLKYFTQWLGLNEVAYLEPVPGSPPTARHLASLRQTLADNHVVAILDSQNYPDKPARYLSDETGVPHIRLLDSVGTEKADTLIEMFDYNVQQLMQITRQ